MTRQLSTKRCILLADLFLPEDELVARTEARVSKKPSQSLTERHIEAVPLTTSLKVDNGTGSLKKDNSELCKLVKDLTDKGMIVVIAFPGD